MTDGRNGVKSSGGAHLDRSEPVARSQIMVREPYVSPATLRLRRWQRRGSLQTHWRFRRHRFAQRHCCDRIGVCRDAARPLTKSPSGSNSAAPCSCAGSPKAPSRKRSGRGSGRTSTTPQSNAILTRAREAHADRPDRRPAIPPGQRRSPFTSPSLPTRTASHRDKTKAQERIDKLLGLEDKSNQPPLEVVLGQLPAAVSGPLRQLLAEASTAPRK